jgi:hypothetical protein
MEEVVAESMERKQCLVDKWEAWNRRREGKYARKSSRRNTDGTIERSVPFEELKQWVAEDPVSNIQTHFACIMDPREGVFRWARSYYEGELEGSDDDMSMG